MCACLFEEELKRHLKQHLSVRSFPWRYKMTAKAKVTPFDSLCPFSSLNPISWFVLFNRHSVWLQFDILACSNGITTFCIWNYIARHGIQNSFLVDEQMIVASFHTASVFICLFLWLPFSGSIFFCVCLLMSISRLTKAISMKIYHFSVVAVRLLLLLQRLHKNITNNDAMMNFHCNGTPLNEMNLLCQLHNKFVLVNPHTLTLTRRTNWQQYQANIACHKFED